MTEMFIDFKNEECGEGSVYSRTRNHNPIQFDHDSHNWQVFFLPLDNQRSDVVAFCPYTKIFAEGVSIDEAAIRWVQEANKKFGGSFLIPKYLYTSCKLYCGNSSSGKPTYILETNQGFILFCPNTKEIFSGITDWKNEIQGDEVSLFPSLVIDLRICCTPLLKTTTYQSIVQSLTPHCIN